MRETVQLPLRNNTAEQSSSSVICARDLVVKYGEDITALNKISFEVFAGEHLVVLGYSGSGKSTLLRTIAGKRKCESGGIICDKKIASIHQDLKLVSQQTALKNVLHGALGRCSICKSATGYSADDKRRAISLLERVGLSNRIFHKVK